MGTILILVIAGYVLTVAVVYLYFTGTQTLLNLTEKKDLRYLHSLLSYYRKRPDSRAYEREEDREVAARRDRIIHAAIPLELFARDGIDHEHVYQILSGLRVLMGKDPRWPTGPSDIS